MESVGKVLVFVGLGIAVLGGLLLLIGQVWPGFKLGRLPGDVVVEQEGFKLFFPITTMILVSVLITFILWLVGNLRR